MKKNNGGNNKYIYFDTSNLKRDIQKSASLLLVAAYLLNLFSPVMISEASSSEIIYPLKQISKLDCRYNDFDTLNSDCKQDLPILNTKDYVKYATQNSGYNDFTRLYTVLWGASYAYGWDIGNGGHEGVDIATAKGTPVYAMTDGVVLAASNLGSLGNTVAIKHIINGQTIVSSYSHLSKIDVIKGDNVSVGQKIGEVGSTGNSTGNHLHFQIDTSTDYGVPAYYDYKSCPYSYYKITEEGICFDQLQKMTVDPLLFLETKGAILANLPSYESSSSNNNVASNGVDMSVFNRTVNVGYSITDIKTVQQIMKDLGYYNGGITGNYNDVIENVIDFQVARGVIATRTSDGSGNFGPATRKQAKADYEKYLAGNPPSTSVAENPSVSTPTGQVKIEKAKLLTREEIEAMEVENFMKDYNIDLKFRNSVSNVSIGGKETIDLTITDKRKGRPFVGNMPGGMTFVVNGEKVDIFPTKILNFTDGTREIQITGLQEGTTKLYIKVGNVSIKTFDINVYNGNKTIYPAEAQEVSVGSVVVGDIQTALVLFKDDKKSPLVNIPFGSTFKLSASEGNKVCIKSGDFKNIRDIYATKCKDEEFKTEINFTYADTVGGILIYDFKALNKTAEFSVINTYDNTTLVSKTHSVLNPKGLASNYTYKNEVITMIEKGVTSGLNAGYFQENNELTQYDAYTWLRNYLINLNNTTDPSNANKSQIEQNLREVATKQKEASKYTYITRRDFLNMASKYLLIDTKQVNITVNYKDLTEAENKIVNYIFNQSVTWKDDFGQTYFQPDKKITRGEGAYFLAAVVNNKSGTYVALK